MAGYQQEKGGPHRAVATLQSDAESALVGVQVPVGAGTVMASHVRTRDRTPGNAGARMIGVAYSHALSRRSNLDASLVSIDNQRALTGDGSGDREFSVGVRHRF